MLSSQDSPKSASAFLFGETDSSVSRSPSRLGAFSPDLSGSSRSFLNNASTSSLGNGNGGAPMHAMMVPGHVVPSTDRPDPDSPFSDWEAYIVKRAQEWNDKRAKSATCSPQPNNGSRIAWANQVRKASPASQAFAYTKVRDRVASPPPQGSPPSAPRTLLRKASLDVFRSSSDLGRNSPSPPSSKRPSISSPILTKSSLLTTVPALPSIPAPAPPTGSISPSNRSMPDLPHNVESMAPSVRSLSPLPLSLGEDNFSASLLINFDKRSSTTSTSSGRAPGPSELLAAPLPALFNSESNGPPSIADTYSMHSRRSSWASSIDLDPAVICTPPLSNEGFQDRPQTPRPAFLADYSINQSDESESEGSIYSNDNETLASLPPPDRLTDQAIREHQLTPQPIFQRLEADRLSLLDTGDNVITPRPGSSLDIASLPREKAEVRTTRARLMSPVAFRKAFSIRKKSSSGASGSGSNNSSSSLHNRSSEDIATADEPAQQTSGSPASPIPPQLPTLATQDMTSWAAAIPAEAPPMSPVEIPASPTPAAPAMEVWPFVESGYPATLDSSEGSSNLPLSPVFSNFASSIRSDTSGLSSPNTSTNGSASGKKKHRIGTPGLTKLPASPTNGALPTLDPHLARTIKTRQRSAGSISSQTPSVALSNASSNSRRGARKSSRSRITDSMRSCGDMASTLAVPVTEQRRFSNRSLSSEGSIDNHSNASDSSSYAKVGGTSDDGMAPLSPSTLSTTTVKGVLRKRASEEHSLMSPKKEVSFDLSATSGFDTVSEDQSQEEEEELLEHEIKQRGHLKLPPMKLQTSSAEATSDVAAPKSPIVLTQDDTDIVAFLSSFGHAIKTVESLEQLDNVHAGSNEWPRREDWASLPAYLMACATVLASLYDDESATLVYSDERVRALTSGSKPKTVTAPLLSSNPLYTSMVRAIVRIASWDQPAVSAGASAIYACAWAKGKLAPLVFVGLALLLATQGAQLDSSSYKDQQELSEVYSRIAPVLLGSESTHQRVRNLLLWRSPKASLRFTGLLLALGLAATRFDSSFILSLPGLLVGLALFVWLPVILHQPEWAPATLKEVNPIDVLLYDVPTDAQHAIITLRRRAARGEQLVHRANSPSALKSLPSLSPTSFDHRISEQELQHVSDILEGAHFAKYNNEAGHLIVLASRVVFRTLAGDLADEEPVSLRDQLSREQEATSPKGCKIAFDARLEKVVRMDKAEMGGLKLKLKNGQTFEPDNVQERDQAFNRILALAPQRWH